MKIKSNANPHPMPQAEARRTHRAVARTMRTLAGCALLATTLLTGCSKEDSDSALLLGGKQPIILTATVKGQSAPQAAQAATRATTYNTWAGNEEVAVQIDGEVKKYTAAVGGTLTVASDVTPWYWQKITETKAAEAWHAATYLDTKPTSVAVKANQSSTEGYQQSDMLWSVGTISYTSPTLTFKHLPAKVVVNLKHGDGVTEAEVKNATVTLVGQSLTSGAIAADWTVAAAATGNETITPSALTTPTTGYQKTVQALVVPQQMQNQKFIKVTIGTDAAARGCYYIPTAEAEANLQADNQYTYNIIVQKNKLAVTITVKVNNNGVAWDESATTGDATAATFRVMIPTVSDIRDFTVTGATDNGSYYEVDNNATTFSLTYTVSDYKDVKGFPVVQGLCDVTRTATSDKLTFTYSNIRSDLKLADDLYIEPGDFYCKDNSNNGYIIPVDVATLTTVQQVACLGIVFKVGRDYSGNWKDDCTYYQKDGITPMPTIHGYVIALYAANGGCGWGSSGTVVGTSDRQDGFCGYKNTNTIKTFDAANGNNLQTNFPATYHATVGYETNHSAPANSSGWFFPSIDQVFYWYTNRVEILASIRKATGKSDFNWGERYYWSSSEYGYFSRDIDAWSVNFGNGAMGPLSKNYGSLVRSIIAF